MTERRGSATDETMRSDETGASGPRAVEGRQVIAPGTRFEGVYEVKRLLGSGAMGMVYLVEHLGLGKEFAITRVARGRT